MNSITGREPRASTLDINQPKETHKKGLVLHGTDFRHAVEFSRSGRAASRPSRASVTGDFSHGTPPAGVFTRWVLRGPGGPWRRNRNQDTRPGRASARGLRTAAEGLVRRPRPVGTGH